jgi:hypothetical protein
VDYATTPQASNLTGLSIQNLREWTSRRALIQADLRPKAKGSPARYTWQTILILRLAVTLRHHFHLELQAHTTLFDRIKTSLHHTPLSGLWGKTLAVYGNDQWSLIDLTQPQQLADEMILVRLNPHLQALAASYVFPTTFATPRQIELFPVQTAIAGARLPRRKPESGAAITDRRALA